MRLRKGDRVRVRSGKDRGREGEIMRVLPREGRVIVGGVNVAKRHTKPRGQTMQGGIIDKDMPISASSVAIACSSCGPTRVRFRVDEQGRKTRACAKCGGEL